MGIQTRRRKAGFYTGWLNLIGLVAILASVAYGAATFVDLTIGTFSESWLAGYSLTRVFLIFVIILIAAALINIFSGHLLSMINNLSVWWHVFGAAAVILILFLVPDQHASFSDVFARTVNNSGIFGGATSHAGFILYVLPISAILTQYTITGYDASATSPRRPRRRRCCGQGHLALDRLFGDRRLDSVAQLSLRGTGRRRGVQERRRGGDDLHPGPHLPVGGCGVADLHRGPVVLHGRLPDECVADDVRLQPRRRRSRPPDLEAGERQGDSRLRRHRDRRGGRDHHTSGLVAVDINGAPVPVAFFAVVSIGVVGLYLCFAVPIYFRWRAGDSFESGSWTLGSKYKWIAPLALAEIALTSIIAMFPTSLGGMPWDPGFAWKYVNYTPLLVGGALVALYVYWHLSVKKWFTGPVTQVTADPVLMQET